MADCPSEELLQRFHAAKLEGVQSQRIAEHVESCQKCQTVIGGLDQRDDSFLKGVGGLTVSDAPVTVSAAGPSSSSSSRDTPKVVIEGYDITRELARGGQGVVYQAIQLQTNRKVAIKVLLEGPYASESSRKRFEREIELVAQMNHPNIVNVLHSGVTPDGHHFYSMDYVRGLPLNKYVRKERPTLEAVLQLFAKVCEAVQFAHYRGIIHRDLKPSNILVDVDGSPKLLDFGLAKWVAAPSRSMISVSEMIVGTLPYMSPEQTRGNPDEVDTRTDIYALGVVLYEALTGHYPYPVVGQMADVLRNIAEHPPDPPTSKWTSATGVTDRMNRTIRSGQCPIESDLQTIILKTLAKERERRYQSAGDLAAEVHRYLIGDPIEAKRDSALYILRKKLARHRGKVAVAAVGLVMMIVFGVMLQLERSRAESLRRSHQATLIAWGAHYMDTARGLPDQARAALDEALSMDPQNFRANYLMANLLKRTYFGSPHGERDMGMLERAVALCDKAESCAPDHESVPNLLNLECTILYSMDRLNEAEAACSRALDLSPELFHASSNLAKVLIMQGRFKDAFAAVQRGIAVNQDGEKRGKYDEGIWLTLAALQSCFADPAAVESVSAAIEVDNEDERNYFMRARYRLQFEEDPTAALDDIIHAVEMETDELDPRFSRVVAMAYLRNDQFEKAKPFATLAGEEEDLPSFAHCIKAIAEARTGDYGAAKYALDMALAHWPAVFDSQPKHATIEKGLVWIDRLEPLEALKAEAEAAVAAARD
jgi:tetratricopeptide (TPR) repeat protein/predicted Ser/Thr protein kinase